MESPARPRARLMPPRPRPTTRLVVLLLAGLAAAACTRDPEGLRSEAAAMAAPPDPVEAPEPAHVEARELPPPVGEWMIVGHRMPGISAMTEAQAAAQYGRILVIEPGRARLDEAQCDPASYDAHEALAARHLAEAYHLTAASLGLDNPADELLGVVEVNCNGQRWGSLGGHLLWVSADRMLAPWDGVFFELRLQ